MERGGCVWIMEVLASIPRHPLTQQTHLARIFLLLCTWCMCLRVSVIHILPSGVSSQANWKCFNNRFHFLFILFFVVLVVVAAHLLRRCWRWRRRVATKTNAHTHTALWNTACRWTSNKKRTWYVYSPRTDKCRIVTIRTGMVNFTWHFIAVYLYA